MKLWLDAHLAPSLAVHLAADLGVEVFAVRDLGLRDATDIEIFNRSREAGCVLVTKDADFSDLVGRLGVPPQVILVTTGNTSSSALRELFLRAWPALRAALDRGEPLVELVQADAELG